MLRAENSRNELSGSNGDDGLWGCIPLQAPDLGHVCRAERRFGLGRTLFGPTLVAVALNDRARPAAESAVAATGRAGVDIGWDIRRYEALA